MPLTCLVSSSAHARPWHCMQGTSPEKEHATHHGTACHVHVWFHPVHMLGPGTACRVQVQKKHMPHTVIQMGIFGVGSFCLRLLAPHTSTRKKSYWHPFDLSTSFFPLFFKFRQKLQTKVKIFLLKYIFDQLIKVFLTSFWTLKKVFLLPFDPKKLFIFLQFYFLYLYFNFWRWNKCVS